LIEWYTALQYCPKNTIKNVTKYEYDVTFATKVRGYATDLRYNLTMLPGHILKDGGVAKLHEDQSYTIKRMDLSELLLARSRPYMHIAVGNKNSLRANKICPNMNMTNLVGKIHERQQTSCF